ncbi:MAG: metal ABC transporter substrate-binding protein [Spirochaetaceae bacterium]|jgi:zinc transport system substrate-binding protein|nr:metal ABC transporter substrate-binding protein [Spirochaetaceae bacterium]
MIKHPVLMIGLAVLLCTAACTKQGTVQDTEGKLNVTAVNFPAYDFVKAVAGDRVNLVMLLPPASESHSYEPTPSDILTVQNSDIFIYTGGESDEWVEQILESMDTASMDIITLMGCVETVEEEVVEGMEEEEEEEEGPAYDEHVWTAPGNAKRIVSVITEELAKKDGANAGVYRQNAAEYLVRLDELDAAFKAVVDGAPRKTIVLGDRFPFRYLTDAYGLSYFAAFPGCSTETEPSAATVAFLINKIKAENIPVIFHIELSNEKMADAISEATGAKKLLLHACHNVSREDFENGVSYLQLQQGNVERLREALW